MSVVDLVGHELKQYRVLEMIGQGGMARVYKAYQAPLDRYVAIKVISVRVDDQRDGDFAARFGAEARVVAKLSHPNIVPVYDYGEDLDWAFIVMEYLSGGTLRDRIARAETARTLLDLAQTLDLLAQAADALDFAHASGVVHRDVKPGNMLLRNPSYLLLTDFGIAAILEATRAYARNEVNVGTPQYMAPEQGIPDSVVDGRADLYSLGVTLFQCVTGRLPFLGDTPVNVIMKQINEPPPRPSAFAPWLPPHVEQIILKAMQKQPPMRYQFGREMAADLRSVAAEVRRNSPRQVVQTQRTTANPPSVVVGPLPPPIPAPPRGEPGRPGTCFRCGAANNPQNRFCTSCGYDLSGMRARADRWRLPDGRILRCRVYVRTGRTAGRVFTLHQDVTTLGRTPGNDVVVDGPTVSRKHARLFFAQGQWLVEDLNSSNGVYVNSMRITHPTPLKHGDEVRLGDEALTFELAPM